MISQLLAIDPGTTESAYVLIDLERRRIIEFDKCVNAQLLPMIGGLACGLQSHLVIEVVASYGMPVGAEVFETCIWTGRFIQEWERWASIIPAQRLTRNEVKMALCHQTAKVNDSVIRQRLLDLWGPQGTKKKPGPTYGFSKDRWAALGVGTAFMMRQGMWK